MRKRLFIALDLPLEIAQQIEAFDPDISGLRWMRAQQLHLTLSFLGDVDEEAVPVLRQTIEQARVPPFLLPLQGMGSFGRKDRPLVVWIGVGRGHPHLYVLHRRIQDAVLKAGLEPDLKAFHPHITVGRARDVSRQTLQPFLRRHAEVDFGVMKVAAFVLYTSTLTSEGPIHEPLHVQPL